MKKESGPTSKIPRPPEWFRDPWNDFNNPWNISRRHEGFRDPLNDFDTPWNISGRNEGFRDPLNDLIPWNISRRHEGFRDPLKYFETTLRISGPSENFKTHWMLSVPSFNDYGTPEGEPNRSPGGLVLIRVKEEFSIFFSFMYVSSPFA